MALVNDDEIEEVRGILAKIGRGLAILGRPAHEGLEDSEEQAAVLGHFAFLPDVLRRDADHGVLGESGEGIVRLIREDIAVREKEDARAAGGLTAEVPAGVEEFPRDLEGDEGFTGAGGQREQDAQAPLGNGPQDFRNSDVLVVTGWVRPPLSS